MHLINPVKVRLRKIWQGLKTLGIKGYEDRSGSAIYNGGFPLEVYRGGLHNPVWTIALSKTKYNQV